MPKIQKREITKELRDSYIDYAMSVIVSRALPDVRDGLKPVQRRILYAMYEMGLKHDAKFRKSAAVTGETMAKFHPHGDAPIYEALVRMAQDFSLRYPLIQGQGNFGSIDGDPPAQQRYCLTGDALVVTSRCLEKIGEISNKEDISLKVLSFGKKINFASKWFDSGIHPILEIKTLRGYSLKATSNHPILILKKDREGKPIFKWRLLKNLKKGDFAVIDRSEIFWPSKEPKLRRYHPIIKNRKVIVNKLPSQMNSDLAFIMGAILAEGYLSVNKKGYIKVGFFNTDQEFLREFRSRLKKVFPGCPLSESKRGPLGWGKKKSVYFQICSLQIGEFFRNLGLESVSSARKRIPQIIFHSTQNSVAEFLKGYFEADGGIYKNQANSCWIDLSSWSENLVKELQIILLRFGIISSRYYNQKREEFILRISGVKNLNLFKEKINFATKRNIERLKKFSQLNLDKKVISKTDYIPYLSCYLREKYRKKKIQWGAKKWLLTHNLDRYHKLENYYPHLKEILEESDLELIQNFLDYNYLFDPIVSVRKRKPERVYSLRVDSTCHSFVSNGFISHNTEVRLSQIGEEMLKDIEKNTIDFTDNYDGTRKEPSVLPSPLPQILLNGSLGIAVGMATSIPPHNLSEVVDALLYLLKNKNASIDEICQFIKGPDFPTGGIIFSKKMIKEAYENGQGPILMRARAEIVEKKKELFEIQITEIPYGISKANLIEQIANLIKEKKLNQIKYLRDESDREGIKISIGLKKEASPNQILNLLSRQTSLERKFYLNMVLLEKGIQPKIFSLKDVLLKFLEHRREVTKRKFEFELERVKERIHILFGLKKAILNINQIISLIKKSKNKEEAKRKLILKFKFSQKQAEVILETKLRTLSKLDRMNIFSQLKEKIKEKRKYEEILRSQKGIDREIVRELTLLKERFGDERKTAIFDFLPKKLEEKELIAKEENILILSRDGYLKRLKPEQFRFQKRGGKGVSIELKEKDKIEHFLKLTSHDEILFFTSKGRVFKIFAYEIPEGDRQAKGKAILNFIDLEPNEKITSIINIEHFKEPLFLFMVTEKGKVKKTKLQAFTQVRRSGLWAIKLEENDQLKFVKLTSGNEIIALASFKGKIILFKESQIRPMGRNAKGVRGMRLNDKIVGLEVISKKESASLLLISENGFAKKILMKKLPLQKRGGKGIIGMKISQKTGGLKVISKPDEKKTIFVISEKGKILKTGIKEIPILSRHAQGVKIIRLKEDDKVASAALI